MESRLIIPGATSKSLTLNNVQPNQNGSYSVVVSNPIGSVASTTATLSVDNLALTTPPASQIVYANDSISFNVAGSGAQLQYQWLFNDEILTDGNGINGSESPTLKINGVTASDEGDYSVLVEDSSCVVQSSEATLTVNPAVFYGPSDTNVTYGQNATFSVQLVSSGTTAHYQWRKHNGTSIVNVGTDSNTYTVVEPQVSASGSQYDVIVTQGSFIGTSRQATLTVESATLYVSANNQNHPFGQPNHPFSYSIGGFAPGDTAANAINGTPLLSTTTTGDGSTSPIGIYPINIVASNLVALIPANYKFEFVDGILTILNDATSSAGTDFWVVFMKTAATRTAGAALSLNIAGPVATEGTCGFSPTLNLTDIPFANLPGSVTTLDIGNQAMSQNYDDIESNGIHVVTSQPVSVYGMNYLQYASEGFTAYPKDMLGNYYCVMSHPCQILGGQFYSEFVVLATEDNTTVTITPSANANLIDQNDSSQFKADPFEIKLQAGQSYQNGGMSYFEGSAIPDVTGTFIQSDKPVVVLAGNDLAFMPDQDHPAGNPLLEEQIPVSYWGKQVFCVPLAFRGNGDSYRVLAAEDNTDVYINGAYATTLESGQFYDTVITGSPNLWKHFCIRPWTWQM